MQQGLHQQPHFAEEVEIHQPMRQARLPGQFGQRGVGITARCRYFDVTSITCARLAASGRRVTVLEAGLRLLETCAPGLRN
jgi:hypothetical protein